MHTDDLEQVIAAVTAFIVDQDRDPVTVRLKHADGSFVQVEIAAAPSGSDDPAQSVVVNLRDVEWRAGAQDALRRSEERFRALVHNAPAGVCVLDADAMVTYASPAMEAMFGRDSQAMVGQLGTNFVHPDDLEALAEKLAAVLATPGATSEMRLRVRHADGTWHRIEANSVNLTEDDAVNGLVVHIRDITEQLDAEDALAATERALRENEEQMRALVEHSDNIVEILDAKGVITWISVAVEAVLGWSVADVFDRQAAELVHPDSLDEIASTFRRALDGPLGTSARGRAMVRCADDSWKWLECVFTNRLDDPVVEGIIGNFRDISQRVQAEDALRASEELFRSLARSSPTGIYQQNADNQTIYVNERWQEITGLSA